jgi:hypothetical protein
MLHSVTRKSWSVLGALALVALVVSAEARAGWTTASGVVAGDTDDDKWADKVKASDGDAAKYAVDKSNRVGNGAWLQLNFVKDGKGVLSDRLRVNADFWAPIADKVEIQVRYDGETEFVAVNVENGVVPNAAYAELALPREGRVNAVRFRWHYVKNGYWFWLYELQLFEVEPPPIDPPQCETLSPSSVNAASAVLRGSVTTDGGGECRVRLVYGTDANLPAGSPATDWAGSFGTGDDFAAFVSNLTAGTTYYYRAEVKNDAGAGAGAVQSFVACPEESEDGSVWVSPTGWNTDSHTYNGHTYEWQEGGNAHDDWDASAARCYHEIHDPELWSPWLYLHTDSALCNGVRFRAAKPDAYVEKVEVQVMSSEWEQVYIGGFAHDTFEVKPFSIREVSEARVRFKMSKAGVGAYWNLYEFDFRKIGVNVVAQNTPYYREENPGVFLATNAPAFPVAFKFAAGIKDLEWGTVTVRVSPRLKLYFDAASTQEFATGTDLQRTYNLGVSEEKTRFVAELLDKTLYAKGVTVSSAERDSPVSCEVAYDYTEVTDTVNFTVRGTFADLDADTDNTTVEPYPCGDYDDRSQQEDEGEDSDNNPGGLELLVNDLDANMDGRPNYAEIQNAGGSSSSEAGPRFEPLILDLSGLPTAAAAKITFTYDGSDPARVRCLEDELGVKTYELPEAGVLRVWKVDGDKDRNPAGLEGGGDYIRPGVQYTAAQLGVGEGGSVRLFVEAVKSYDSSKVKVVVDADGTGGHKAEDTVRTSTLKVSTDNPANLR